MKEFQFQLGQMARIRISGEAGQITARSQYIEDPCLYRLEYKAADGCAATDWFRASQLEPVI